MENNIKNKIRDNYYDKQDLFMSDMFPGKKRLKGETEKFRAELSKRMKLKDGEFKKDLFTFFDVMNNSKAEVLFEKSSSYGEPGHGRLNTFLVFEDLVELIK